MKKVKHDAEKVAALKAKFCDIFSVETEKGNLYFKKPDRNAFALALSYRTQSKMLESGEVLVENCLVGGATEILDDEYLKIAVSLQIANIIELPEVVVKKL